MDVIFQTSNSVTPRIYSFFLIVFLLMPNCITFINLLQTNRENEPTIVIVLNIIFSLSKIITEYQFWHLSYSILRRLQIIKQKLNSLASCTPFTPNRKMIGKISTVRNVSVFPKAPILVSSVRDEDHLQPLMDAYILLSSATDHVNNILGITLVVRNY